MSSDSNKENTKAISIKDGNFQWDDNQIKIQSLLNTSKIQGLVQIDSAPNISSFNLYIGKNTSFFKNLKILLNKGIQSVKEIKDRLTNYLKTLIKVMISQKEPFEEGLEKCFEHSLDGNYTCRKTLKSQTSTTQSTNAKRSKSYLSNITLESRDTPVGKVIKRIDKAVNIEIIVTNMLLMRDDSDVLVKNKILIPLPNQVGLHLIEESQTEAYFYRSDLEFHPREIPNPHPLEESTALLFSGKKIKEHQTNYKLEKIWIEILKELDYQPESILQHPEIDAIVNVANRELTTGVGLSGIIWKYGGQAMQEDLKLIISKLRAREIDPEIGANGYHNLAKPGTIAITGSDINKKHRKDKGQHILHFNLFKKEIWTPDSYATHSDLIIAQRQAFDNLFKVCIERNKRAHSENKPQPIKSLLLPGLGTHHYKWKSTEFAQIFVERLRMIKETMGKDLKFFPTLVRFVVSVEDSTELIKEIDASLTTPSSKSKDPFQE